MTSRLFRMRAATGRARRRVVDWMLPNLRAARARRDPLVWLIALVGGFGIAGAAIAFRELIGLIQVPWLMNRTEYVVTAAGELPWWVILLAPAAGGVVVAAMLVWIMPGRRAEAVADVIEAHAVGGSYIPLRRGLTSALISAVTLGSGASAGREGPVVHLGASLASSLARYFNLPGAAQRTILGCGVAAAVSASFNVPIAGVLFAHEVILGHYALSAFVPIVLSSVGAAVVSRGYYGDFSAFFVPAYQITSYWEFPAFALLGLTCAVVAILFQFALIGTDMVARNIHVPLWVRPIVGGLMVGAIGVFFPHILGVGYQATDMALTDRLPLMMMLILIVMKTAATAITLASRFGGGVFSPALYLGAMTGGAFGVIASMAAPDLASSGGLYAILGMGAVAAAVLGAPISTTMIVFELTGGLALSIALLLAVSVATATNQLVHGRSYFHWQLNLRGLFLYEGPHKRLVRLLKVSDFMRRLAEDAEDKSFDPDSGDPWLTPADTIESALRSFDNTGATRIAVIDENDTASLLGWAHHVDALNVFNAALIEASEEEHR